MTEIDIHGSERGGTRAQFPHVILLTPCFDDFPRHPLAHTQRGEVQPETVWFPLPVFASSRDQGERGRPLRGKLLGGLEPMEEAVGIYLPLVLVRSERFYKHSIDCCQLKGLFQVR